MIRFHEDKKARLKLRDQIRLLSLSTKDENRLLRQMGNQTRSDLRSNIRRQKTVDGSGMAPRANARNKRKMMRKMGKGTKAQVRNHKAFVTWKNGGVARVACLHDKGIEEKQTPFKMKKRFGVPDYRKPATKAQAKALNKEGFKRRVKGKKGKAVLKRVPQKWIIENMRLGQAGLVLRLMRTGKRTGVQSWVTKPPPRSILGATEKDADKYLTAMAGKTLQKIKR